MKKISIVFLLFLSGCYSQKKASVQLNKIDSSFPTMLARYCGVNHPCKEGFIVGKDIIIVDTLLVAGEDRIIIDTSYYFDTIYVTKTVTLPPKIVTKKIVRVDTSFIDGPKLGACELERVRVSKLLEAVTIESDRWKKIAIKRFWIIVGLLGLISFGLFIKFQSFKKIKI
jgi:hypothetical protein